MIARKNRFHGHGSLRFVYKNGKVIRSQLYLIKYCSNPKRSAYRAAIVVSKKVHKSAVVRNRIRRRLYEIIRELNITKPIDIVFVLFDERVATMDAGELKEQIVQQLTAAHIC